MVDDNKDLYNWGKWKQTRNKKYFQELYNDYKGILGQASLKASRGSNLPPSVFKMEAADRFLKALDTYNPSYGTKLSTHVFGSVENKLKRLNRYQNVARIPERQKGRLGVFDITSYQNAVNYLDSYLGREPTDEEVATELSVPVKDVRSIRLENRKDLSLNEQLDSLAAYDDSVRDTDLLQMAYYDMNTQQKQYYDFATGSHGKPKLVKTSGLPDNQRISQSMGLSYQKVNRIRKQVFKLVEEAGR